MATFVAAVFVSFLVFSIIAPRDKTASTPSDSKPKTSDNKQSESTTTPTESKKPEPAPQPKQTPAPAPTPSTPACKSFTQQLAVQILGNTAVASMSDSVIISETSDMRTSTCVYTKGASATSRKTVSLVAHEALTSLGQSANTVEFGSGRPAGAQTAIGFGQAAFWDNTATLHVLKNNNHYAISLTNGEPPQPASQPDTESAASIIVPKL